jgi:capsular exopolysaccharide synthesis family protein
VAEVAPPPRSLREALVDPVAASAESFRTLRLALQLRAQAADTTAVLVTSAEPRTGKSTVAANYANLTAFGGARVLLVDADVRNPVQDQIFGLPRSPGLVEYVAGRASINGRTGPPSLDRLVHHVSVQLHVLTAGQPVARASDVTHSPRLVELIHDASERYDVVVVDTAPVLATADAEAIAAHAGVEIVFVVDQSSRRRNVTKALRRLELINARIAGLVLNRQGEPVVYTY